MNNIENIGPHFQEATKYVRGRAVPQAAMWATPPSTYKTYDSYLETTQLPEPVVEGGQSLWEAVSGRRSRRKFGAAPMSMEELSQLLWATQGVNAEVEGFELRTAASAGALYPNETYVVSQNVEGLAAGVHHYMISEHSLGMLTEGDFADELAQACLEQTWMTTAGAVFVWGAVVARSAWKYQNRAYRYLYLDAGHIGGQLQLACQALGLVSCNIGAYLDNEVASLIGLDGRAEVVVYITAVGHGD